MYVPPGIYLITSLHPYYVLEPNKRHNRKGGILRRKGQRQNRTYCKVGTNPSTTVISGTFVNTGFSGFPDPEPLACPFPLPPAPAKPPLWLCFPSLTSSPATLGGLLSAEGFIDACACWFGGWERGSARPDILRGWVASGFSRRGRGRWVVISRELCV